VRINSNINILGGLADFNLIKYFLLSDKNRDIQHVEFTDIRTLKAVKRFKKVIIESFEVKNEKIMNLLLEYVKNENIENLSYILFLMLSNNNDLFMYLNENVFLPVYYSGRMTLKKDEIVLCLKDLQKTNEDLKKWSDSTLETTASKYLTLLKKLGLAIGVQKKEIVYKSPSFEDFVLFNYFFDQIEPEANKYNSKWIQYSFFEKDFFIQKILDKKLMRFLEIHFSGDNLKIKTLTNYQELYYALKSA